MKRRTITAYLLITIMFFTPSLAGCTPFMLNDDETRSPAHNDVSTIPAEVVKVIDGDTIKVKLNQREETIRLLLIDTPETVHPDKPVQPFGPEASSFVKNMLPPGSNVEIEIDISERDKYGRLLAYVYAGDVMVNEALLEQGLARVAYIFPPNIKYVDQFRAIQDSARQAERGIWSLENYATDNGYQATADNTSSVAETDSTELLYNPEGPDRDCGDFPTQKDAQLFFQAAGGPSSDPHRLDRDGDGIACDNLP